MLCKNCKSQSNENAKFCHNCGGELKLEIIKDHALSENTQQKSAKKWLWRALGCFPVGFFLMFLGQYIGFLGLVGVLVIVFGPLISLYIRSSYLRKEKTHQETKLESQKETGQWNWREKTGLWSLKDWIVGGIALGFIFFMVALVLSGDKKEDSFNEIAQPQDPQSQIKEIASVPEQVSQTQYEMYKRWQDSSGTFQQVIIIPSELRNERDLFVICDELNEKTKNQKSITVRGFTNKAAADATMLIDEAPQLLWQLSNTKLKTINYHAVLVFDKFLSTPLKIFECNIYPQGFDHLGKTKKY